MDPPPLRDARWIDIVLGSALLVVGVILAAVSTIVSGALSLGGGGCGGATGCPDGSPASWLGWASVPFLIVGVVLLAIGLWRAFR